MHEKHENSPISASPPRHPVRPLVVVAFLLVVALESLLALHLWQGHSKAEADSRLLGATLGQAVEQHVAGQMRGVGALLDETAAIVQAGHQHTPAVTAHLRERLTAFPEILSLLLVAADGSQTVLHGEDGLSAAGLSWLNEVTDRASVPAGLVVGRPLPDNGHRLPAARVFPRRGQQAAVVALLDADHLAAYLQTVMVPETRRLSVVHASGLVVAQAPDHSLAFAWPVPEVNRRLGVDVAIEDLELKVEVEMDGDRTFGDWRVNAALQLVVLLLFCLALYYWARRGEAAWRQLVAIRDGLEDQVERRGVELQQASALLERRVRQVGAANRELQRLSMVAAHHLQEPLRPLVSYSQILAKILPAERLAGTAMLDNLINGGKEMKALLRGFQQRVAALSIDAPAQMVELRQAVQMAMVDSGVGIPIRQGHLPSSLSVPTAVGDVLVQVLRTLDGLGGREIHLQAVPRQGLWLLELTASGGLKVDSSASTAVGICLSLASLNQLRLEYAGDGFRLELGSDDAPSAEPPPMAENGPEQRVLRARAQSLGLLAVLALVVSWQVWREHQSAIHAAQVLTRAVANSIDQQISGSLRAIDTILAEAAEAHRSGADKEPAFSVRMEAILRAFPEINFIGHANAQGELSPVTWPPMPVPPQTIRVDDRAYFQMARNLGRDGIVVGDPALGKLTHSRAWHLARPLFDPRGNFAGAVLANVNPDHYARFLDRVLLDPQGGTALIGANGLMIARAPAHAQKFAMDISSSDLFTKWLRQSPSGTAHLVSKADGNDKFLAYRSLSPYPLVVTSGVSRNKALADWKNQSAVTVTVAALLGLALFVLAWRADRGMRRIQRQHRPLEAEVARRTLGLEQARAQSDARAASLDRLNLQLRDILTIISSQLHAPLLALHHDVAQATELIAANQDGPGREELGYVAAAIDRLSSLLRDFQRFVAVVGASPRLGVVDLAGMVRLAADEMDRRFGTGVLLLSTEGLTEIVADSTLMMELLLQVFANAVTYRGRDEAVTVRVRLIRRGREWQLQVADDGPGLPTDMIRDDPQAFEAGAGQTGGSTGIGLAICRVIAQAHGGEMWLNNGVEGGAEINVTLADADQFLSARA